MPRRVQITGAAPAEDIPAEAEGMTTQEGGDQEADETGAPNDAKASPETETAVAGQEREGGTACGRWCRQQCWLWCFVSNVEWWDWPDL